MRQYYAAHYNSFNEATLFQAWKESRSAFSNAHDARFNEATLFQAWKEKARTEAAMSEAGFNEATLFQAWKGSTIPRIGCELFQLQ